MPKFNPRSLAPRGHTWKEIGMKGVLIFFGLAAVVGAFFVGRATNSDAAPMNTAGRIYTGAIGDVFRVPAASMRCTVSQEGGSVNVLCSHTPRPRYTVSFFSENLFVFRNGRPDDPVFSARGRP